MKTCGELNLKSRKDAMKLRWKASQILGNPSARTSLTVVPSMPWRFAPWLFVLNPARIVEQRRGIHRFPGCGWLPIESRKLPCGEVLFASWWCFSCLVVWLGFEIMRFESDFFVSFVSDGNGMEFVVDVDGTDGCGVYVPMLLFGNFVSDGERPVVDELPAFRTQNTLLCAQSTGDDAHFYPSDLLGLCGTDPTRGIRTEDGKGLQKGLWIVHTMRGGRRRMNPSAYQRASYAPAHCYYLTTKTQSLASNRDTWKL